MSNRSLIGNNENSEIECFRLLKLLKLTVERLLAGYSPNVWNTYGSLSRLRAIIDDIFTHGLIYEGPQKYSEFLSELFILKPESRPSDDGNGKVDGLTGNTLCCQWLEKSLLEHTLSLQIQMLIRDEYRILRYYKETAFLHNKACTDALLICLRAVENNQPALLASLDPCLAMKASDQSCIIQNATFDIPYARKQTHGICDNSKEAFETSSSLDYVTPPESLTDLDIETRNLFIPSDVYRASDDGNGNTLYHAADRASSLSVRNDHQQAWKNISQYSNQNCLSNLLTNFAFDKVAESIADSKGCISPYSVCVSPSSVSTTGSSQVHTTSKSSQDKALPRNDSNSNTSPPSSLFKSESSHSLPTNLNLNCKVVQSTSCQRNHSTLNSSSFPFDCQGISNSFAINDRASCSTATPNFEDSRYPNPPLEEAAEVTEHGSTSVPSWKAQHSRSKSDGTATFQNGLFPDEMETSTDAGFSASLPSILPKDENEKQRKKSIFEDDQVTVPTECFFPRPQPGQTLTSFLSSNDFNICAELDKENAHFFIAEALISAIEKIKCTQSLKHAIEEVESDEEIKTLTQRIRIRRREKMREKEIRSLNFLSDGKTDTTSQSASPRSSSHSSDFGAGESIGSGEDEFEDLEILDHTTSNLTAVKESGLSLSMASLYSDADIKKVSNLPLSTMDAEEPRSYLENSSSNSMQLSAEAIALSLLKQFSEKQLPKASDLQWLVSEQEVAQRLLPLPDSWPVSPDSIDEYNLEKTRLRGNLEWAPPRRQIIFNIQPDPKRKSAILKQNYRCAGCGMKIEKSYIKKFRYCDYLGKYFCQCCHSNNLSYIPGRILWKWDFKSYHVSKFASKLLDQMLSDPLFNVQDMNPNLYHKVRQLDMCREYRIQLSYLKDFIRTCRKTEAIQKEFEEHPQHILNDPHQYSISDFIQVKSGELSKCLSTLVSKCISHVAQCMLCRAKGFICEMCDKDKDVIFPFQLSKVVHCLACGACFHKKCYKPGICPKCIRIKQRKSKLLEQEAIRSKDKQ